MQFYDCPTDDCGSGSNAEREDELSPMPDDAVGNGRARRLPSMRSPLLRPERDLREGLLFGISAAQPVPNE